ncbi:MAG: hypothetical protein HRT47_01705 [Candidatus Caenarcaniphilales bacterium]|nr:hypothetical protein [Candidatus Caenarcaniphilales bacterium]
MQKTLLQLSEEEGSNNVQELSQNGVRKLANGIRGIGKLISKSADFTEHLAEPDHPQRRFLTTYANFISIGVNLIAETLLKGQNWATKVGGLFYRGFLAQNGLLNGLSGLKANKPIFAGANGMEIAFALSPIPLDKLYKFRGIPVGIRNLINSLLKSAKEKHPEGYPDLISTSKIASKRFLEFFKETAEDHHRIYSQDKPVHKKHLAFLNEVVLNEETGFLGIFGGLSSILGAGLYASGQELAGKIFRDIIGALGVDIDRLLPKNFAKGRLFTGLAGGLFGAGSIFDMNKYTPAQILSDSAAQVSTTIATARGELDKDRAPVPNPIKQPVAFISAIGDGLKETFGAKPEAIEESSIDIETLVKELAEEEVKKPEVKKAKEYRATDYYDYDYYEPSYSSEPKAEPNLAVPVSEPEPIEERKPIEVKEEIPEIETYKPEPQESEITEIDSYQPVESIEEASSYSPEEENNPIEEISSYEAAEDDQIISYESYDTDDDHKEDPLEEAS